ncbi:unnamed protein product, partial [Phaeothamnion confervicola]
MVVLIPLAFTSSGELKLPNHCHKIDGPFLCRDCGNEVILKKGLIKCAHFAHKAREVHGNGGTSCPSESTIHLAAKEIVFQTFSWISTYRKCPSCDEAGPSTRVVGARAKKEEPLDGFQIDVAIFDASGVVTTVFEVCHTHESTRTKVAHFKDTLVEVDASAIL